MSISKQTCLVATLAALAPCVQAEDSVDDVGGFYVFLDELDDESDIKMENNFGSASLENEEWDRHQRLGFGVMSQKLVGNAAGMVLKYGFEIGYSNYEASDSESELEGEALMLSPRIGLGAHVGELLFVEAVAFAGVGLSQFTYEHETYGIDEESDNEVATEYGVQLNAYFSVSDSVMLGARVGWMSQHLEGEFTSDGLAGDTDFESDSEGIYYGLMFGMRF